MRASRSTGVVAASSLPMAARAMTVDTFLAKVKVLQAEGPLALTSSDLPLVRYEVKIYAAAYRAQIGSDKRRASRRARVHRRSARRR